MIDSEDDSSPYDIPYDIPFRIKDIYHVQIGNIPKLLDGIIKQGKRMGYNQCENMTHSQVWDLLENIAECPDCGNMIKGLRSSSRSGDVIDFMVMCRTCSKVGSALCNLSIIA